MKTNELKYPAFRKKFGLAVNQRFNDPVAQLDYGPMRKTVRGRRVSELRSIPGFGQY
jgi:hypothetical protein